MAMMFNALFYASLVPLGVILRNAFRGIIGPANIRRTSQKRNISLTAFGFISSAALLAFLWKHGALPSSLFSLAAIGVGWRVPVLGLTGGIGSGKSTASAYLTTKLGYVLVDADKVAREVVMKGTSGYNAIRKTFGDGIIDPGTGEIDRKALGAIVFVDKDQRKRLESITHPRILYLMLSRMILARLLGKRVIVDVPLLFESKTPILYYLCCYTVLVDAEEATQRSRLLHRNPEWSESEIDNRIKSQMPREQKRALADIVIDNNGSVEELHRQLDFYFSSS